MKDANGTGFKLLLGPDDWTAALATPGSADLAWEGEAGSVALAPIIERFPERASTPRLTPEDRRGADCDQFGNWYWIDASRRRIRTWRTGQAASDYWSADSLDETDCPPADGDFAPKTPTAPRYDDVRLSGLAVTSSHHLLVGTLAPAGLLVFDLHAAGPPISTTWPTPLEIAVFDMAAAAGGGAWLLDRGRPGSPARLWRLDERLRLARLDGLVVVPPKTLSDFAPKGAAPEPAAPSIFPEGLALEMPGPDGQPGPSAAVWVVGLPDDTVLILDAPPGAPSRVLRYGGGLLLAAVALDAGLLGEVLPSPAEIRGHDMAFLPDPSPPPGIVRGALVVVDGQGDQAFRFALSADAAAPGPVSATRLDLLIVPDLLPLRRFGGRALIAHGDQVHYDLDERWPAIAADPRRRRQREGRLGPVRFDGGQPGIEWGRIVMDACIPAGTTVTVEIRAADTPDTLARARWNPLPTPYRRGAGPETPFWQPFGISEPPIGTGSWETFVQGARGQLLELRLELTGDGRNSPRLRALRLHFPRFSYIERYLPSLYREDAVSADFLGRFLANTEGIFTAIEDRVAAAYGLFDTRITLPEWLDWLAGWLGGTLGPDWDDARRRMFIDHAELLFRWRGTPAGLKAMIDLATDPCPDASLFDDLRVGRPPDPDAARRGVRLAEGYARRLMGGVTLDPVTELAGWSPDAGAEPLHRAFAEFALARRATDLAGLAEAWGRPIATEAAVRLSPLVPEAEGEAEDWRGFTAGPIGFPYAAATTNDAARWQAFLAQRYNRVTRLVSAHQLTGPGLLGAFDDIALPATLPEGGVPLADWIDFVSGVLPVTHAAHRFTVLAPAEPGEDRAQRIARIGRIADVVERERPAHTAYEVRPFWALFQAGTARLGIDTTLGAGARFAAIELGRSALGEGFLGYGHPLSVTDRAVVGRDAAGEVRL